MSPRSRRRSQRRPSPVGDRRRPAEDALVFIRALGERHVELEHGRFVLAVAFMMTCPSLEHAQRLLAIVEECHIARGIDLHHAIRARAR